MREISYHKNYNNDNQSKYYHRDRGERDRYQNNNYVNQNYNNEEKYYRNSRG